MMCGTNYEYLLEEYLSYDPLDNIDPEDLIKVKVENENMEKKENKDDDKIDCPF